MPLCFFNHVLSKNVTNLLSIRNTRLGLSLGVSMSIVLSPMISWIASPVHVSSASIITTTKKFSIGKKKIQHRAESFLSTHSPLHYGNIPWDVMINTGNKSRDTISREGGERGEEESGEGGEWCSRILKAKISV